MFTVKPQYVHGNFSEPISNCLTNVSWCENIITEKIVKPRSGAWQVTVIWYDVHSERKENRNSDGQHPNQIAAQRWTNVRGCPGSHCYPRSWLLGQSKRLHCRQSFRIYQQTLSSPVGRDFIGLQCVGCRDSNRTTGRPAPWRDCPDYLAETFRVAPSAT